MNEMNYKDESAQVLEMVDPFDIGEGLPLKLAQQ